MQEKSSQLQNVCGEVQVGTQEAQVGAPTTSTNMHAATEARKPADVCRCTGVGSCMARQESIWRPYRVVRASRCAFALQNRCVQQKTAVLQQNAKKAVTCLVAWCCCVRNRGCCVLHVDSVGTQTASAYVRVCGFKGCGIGPGARSRSG